MSANFTPEKEDYKILTPFKMQVLTNFPYIEADFDALTNYQLLCKIVEYLNEVIRNENEVTEQVTSLYNAYVSLQNYVNNYFNNLDVQEEINNKLDEMVESGTLQEIIADYLNSKAIFGFDNVESMKESTNLINGSYVQTLGYYEKNDGGKALYKIRTITNEDIVDNASIIPLSNENLIAELISNYNINAEQFGCYGNNINDDTLNLQKLFTYAYNKNLNIVLNKKYKISSNLEINRGVNLTGNSLNAGIYGNNNYIYIKGGSQNSSYVDKTDIMDIKDLYFYKTGFVLGDTTNDFGSGITFNKCIFYGKNNSDSAIIVKNNTWIFTINDCKIGNFTHGIYFKFKNDDNSYVVNSGAAIKIIGTDIFNCTNALYVKGSAADGYNIQITSCNFEHNDYSIYTEDGRGNNIQCNNLHIEGNRVGSIYSDKVNVFISNLWDFDSNPNTYIAKFTAINNGKIIINSGRLNWDTNKLIKNIDSKIFLNLDQLITPPIIFNGQIATNDSTNYIIAPNYYNYQIPNSIKTKVYENNNTQNLIFLQPNSKNGVEMNILFRQLAPTPHSNQSNIAIFFNSTSQTGNALIPIPYYSTFINLKIRYLFKSLIIEGYHKVDGGEEVPFCKFINLPNENSEESRNIYLKYSYDGTATLNTISLDGKFLNNDVLVD